MDREAKWGLAFVFYAAALILTAIGFYVMYTYGDKGSDTGKVVGGDAYNYIIIAVRGLGYIISGLTCAVIATTLSHLSVRPDVIKPAAVAETPAAPQAN
jgi:hypothetical protein